MMTSLVIAEHDNQTLKPATLNAISAALACGGSVEVLVAGHQAASVAQQAAQITGVAKVWHADHESLAHALAESLTALVLGVARQYTHVVLAATAQGKNVAPRLAALLDVAAISDVVQIQSPNTYVRPIYAGNAMATVQSTDAIQVLTIRTTAFDAAQAGAAAAPIEALAVQPIASKSTYVSSELATSARPDLAVAKVVVSGGRALGSAEKFDAVLTPLADKLGAAIGASRAAVDAGYAPNDWQVGQTGKIVAPQLYVACGISGAIQHLAGMKDSKIIVAINKDPDAPIFSVADYGLVADLFEVIPQWVQAHE
jgi:electron transfer flavoprotein alpha subunit